MYKLLSVLSRASFPIEWQGENRQDFVVVKLDMKNALNEVSRASIIETLQNEPSLSHLSWHASVTLAPSCGLETGGTRWRVFSEGTAQRQYDASDLEN